MRDNRPRTPHKTGKSRGARADETPDRAKDHEAQYEIACDLVQGHRPVRQPRCAVSEGDAEGERPFEQARRQIPGPQQSCVEQGEIVKPLEPFARLDGNVKRSRGLLHG
jgi:hypothetical protein